uniref:Rpn family recombination-promoting nuclease/putative transposase n=1 Tax=Candidatus Kentrum sp. LFY TaxID=2126342 RepID=A0A450WMN1_9GAMM|nr:MAG: conserved hypothetical protein (putative transposase or invertase) [Candidatus Kentron sp. LFY]
MKRRLITFDWALKRLLRSKANYEVLEGFLSELLREDITILDILESESNKETRLDKSNRLDIKVKDQKGEIILIEFQYEPEFDYLQRILFGASKAITEHMAESEHYQGVVKVISVNILFFNLGHGTDYVYHGRTVFQGIHYHDELHLDDRQKAYFGKEYPHQLYPEYYLLEIRRFDDIARDSLDEWIYFLKHQQIKEEFQAKGLKKAKEILDIINLPGKERAAYEWHVEERRYRASLYDSAIFKGRMDGKKEGLKEGREKGREEGREESAITMAKKMKQKGLPVDEIAEYTGLSADRINELHSEARARTDKV